MDPATMAFAGNLANTVLRTPGVLGGSGTAAPVNQSNGGNNFDFSGFSVVTGQNNSQGKTWDWKTMALLGAGVLLLWKISKKS